MAGNPGLKSNLQLLAQLRVAFPLEFEVDELAHLEGFLNRVAVLLEFEGDELAHLGLKGPLNA
jgi:hypothetical protein